jgi:signal transduction histidine kinase
MGIFMVGAVGLLLSHGSRVYVERWGLKQMGWRRLLPRMLGLAVLLSTAWTIIGFGWVYGILGDELPDNLNPFLLMLLSIVNGVIIYVTWFLGYFGYHVFDRFNRSEIERLRLATVVKDAELRALKSQVNPHFIFNSLNSVRALIDEDPQRARSAVTQLANMLRYSLQSGTKETVAFEDELTVVNDYLALEQVRHEERLRLRLDIAPAALHRMVPPMLLQTLVENAVKYGVSTRPQGGEIAIEAGIENSDLIIAVRNPGHLTSTPRKSGEKPSTRVGLRNALDRLRLLCGDTASLDLRQTGADEVTATIIIPESKRSSPPPSPPSSEEETTSVSRPASFNPALSG